MRTVSSFALVVLIACGGGTGQKGLAPFGKPAALPPPVPKTDAQALQEPHATCGGRAMTVKFYDAGQALSALVTLPDGRHVLVDAGEDPKRPACPGGACKVWHQRVMDELVADLNGAPIDMLWITHLHSDHLGGVPDLVAKVKILTYVDNGRDPSAVTTNARSAATAAGTSMVVIDQTNAAIPLEAPQDVTLTAIVPPEWLPICSSKPDENMCSIALRIDYCASSVLFTGDMGKAEEAQLRFKQVSLLQVGHHGSETAGGDAFLQQVAPRYAVISAGRPDEGTNNGYCHPRATTVKALTAAMGGAGSTSIHSYHAKTCPKGQAHTDWEETPANDHLWATPRDGDVQLTTTGDGTFSLVAH